MSRKSKKAAVGIDVGGTSMRAAVVDAAGEILGEAEDKTDVGGGLEGVTAQVAACVKAAAKDAGMSLRRLAGVGVGVPGAVDSARGQVYTAPNLGWTEAPFGDTLREALGCEVAVDNDVNVAVLGEQKFGAARGVDDVLGVWVGTGIGGGVVLGGRLHRGARAAAGEVGHTIVLPDGPVCGCGNRGCVEALASRTAIEREIFRAVHRGDPSVVPELLEAKGKTRVTSGILKKALARKDPTVQAAMRRAVRFLGIALSGWVNVLDPARVVLGGGVVEKLGDSLVERVEEEANRHTIRAAGRFPEYVAAELGDQSGILGAAGLVLG